MKDIRVLIIDDKPGRSRIKNILGKEGGIRVVGECLSAEEGILQIVALNPDIVLMDVRIPGMDWIMTAGSIKRSGTGSGIEVIALAESANKCDTALEAGAAACLMKDEARPDLIRTIRSVYSEGRKQNTQVYPGDEVVELVVSPASDGSTQILRFMYRLGEVICGDIAAVVCSVGSFGEGSVITLRSKRAAAGDLAVKLKQIPEVGEVKEEVPAGNSSSRITRKVDFLSRLGISPVRRFHITLKEETD